MNFFANQAYIYALLTHIVNSMAASKEKIRELRTLLGGLDGASRRECFTFQHSPCALPKGVLIELTGKQKTEWFLEFLKENKKLNVFWFEKKQTLFPTAIHQRGIALERIVFGVVDDIFEAARKVLQSQAFPLIVLPSIFEDDRILKALQLIAERSNTSVFLMAQHHHQAWPIHLQLEINKGVRAGTFNVVVSKNKHGASLAPAESAGGTL
jgi:hypothetical protein